jgi:TonB family protein
VKEKRFRHVAELINRLIFSLVFVVTALSVYAQTTTASDTDAAQKRLKRARALVAAHQLEAAASELTAIRNTTTDDAVRDVARIMLMSVFLEEGDYMRGQSLLEETYKLCSPTDENSSRTYFALAGQAINGVREHFTRYRSFGINITDKELPTEATNDLGHMRMMLERIAEQAREMSVQNEKCLDALGLLEEAANMRGTLAKNNQDRLKWQDEVSDAREKLAAQDTRIASVSETPARTTAPVINSPAIAAPTAAPNHTGNTTAKKKEPAKETAKETAPKNPAPVIVQQANTASAEAIKVSASKDGKPMEIGSLIEMATQRVNPLYPQTAKTAHITGTVTVYLEIDEKGAVKAVHRTNGPQLLRQAAEEAVRRWKFRPTVIDGQAVSVLGFINFNFTL